MSEPPCVDGLQVSTYRIPTDGPEADGTLRWNATELVVVHASIRNISITLCAWNRCC